MFKRVLLVGTNTFSVLLTALRDTLIKNNYEVDFMKLDINEINNIKQVPDIVIIYAGEGVTKNSEGLVFLSDYCVEQERRIALIGQPDELIAMKPNLADSTIFNYYERPVDVKLLIDDLDKEIEQLKAGVNKKHILVVDDSEIQLKLIKSWLSEKYVVSTVNSATQAISFLSKEKVDLILLDYEMPVCSGPRFLEMIQGEVSTSSIPVIFLTAMGDVESVKSVVALRPAGYLLKSMPPAEIIKCVDDFFEKRKS